MVETGDRVLRSISVFGCFKHLRRTVGGWGDRSSSGGGGSGRILTHRGGRFVVRPGGFFGVGAAASQGQQQGEIKENTHR